MTIYNSGGRAAAAPGFDTTPEARHATELGRSDIRAKLYGQRTKRRRLESAMKVDVEFAIELIEALTVKREEWVKLGGERYPMEVFDLEKARESLEDFASGLQLPGDED